MPTPPAAPLEVLTEYNPERRTAVQIVPALIGVILTMTMVIFTAIALVRERERGNLELLITTPVASGELMIGKLAPYVIVGLIQTTIVLATGVLLFDVPINGSIWQLYRRRQPVHRRDARPGAGDLDHRAAPSSRPCSSASSRCCPRSCCPGSCFPSTACRAAARWLAQVLPLTHFNQIVRGIVLRGADLGDLGVPVLKLAAFLVVAVGFAALRFRKRLG